MLLTLRFSRGKKSFPEKIVDGKREKETERESRLSSTDSEREKRKKMKGKRWLNSEIKEERGVNLE